MRKSQIRFIYSAIGLGTSLINVSEGGGYANSQQQQQLQRRDDAALDFDVINDTKVRDLGKKSSKRSKSSHKISKKKSSSSGDETLSPTYSSTSTSPTTMNPSISVSPSESSSPTQEPTISAAPSQSSSPTTDETLSPTQGQTTTGYPTTTYGSSSSSSSKGSKKSKGSKRSSSKKSSKKTSSSNSSGDDLTGSPTASPSTQKPSVSISPSVSLAPTLEPTVSAAPSKTASPTMDETLSPTVATGDLVPTESSGRGYSSKGSKKSSKNKKKKKRTTHFIGTDDTVDDDDDDNVFVHDDGVEATNSPSVFRYSSSKSSKKSSKKTSKKSSKKSSSFAETYSPTSFPTSTGTTEFPTLSDSPTKSSFPSQSQSPSQLPSESQIPTVTPPEDGSTRQFPASLFPVETDYPTKSITIDTRQIPTDQLPSPRSSSCRSSLCSVRTEENEGNFCCSTDDCQQDDVIYPFPYFRYQDFGPSVLFFAETLGYTKYTWNYPGTNDVEAKSWMKIDGIEQFQSLGFTAGSWDCWINHYTDYSWQELQCYSLDAAYKTLGWYESVWENNDGYVPGTELKLWEELTDEERVAAKTLCFFEETWNGIDIRDWNDDWDSFLDIQKESSQQVSSAVPTYGPTFISIDLSLSPSFEQIITRRPSSKPVEAPSTTPSSTPTASPTDEDERICRSSICSIRTELNEGNFCCGLFSCDEESIVHPVPYFRFQPYSAMEDESLKYYANLLGYTIESWDVPGESDLEATSSYKDVEKKIFLDSMGWNQYTWDCWINHYRSYSFDELECYGLADAYRTLGWSRATWESTNKEKWPITEFTSWEFLYDEEKQAAEKLCYTPELWDNIPLANWVEGWDKYFLSNQPSSSTSPTSMPSSTPSMTPTIFPTETNEYSCRSSICSIRTSENREKYCCGLFECDEEAIVQPLPTFRYTDWTSMKMEESPVFFLANQLGYTKDSWDNIGTNEIEHDAYASIDEQVLLDEMGFNQFTWDCWMNHYIYYTWEELECYNLAESFEILGWNSQTWESDDVSDHPLTEQLLWVDLSDEEKLAAQKICYFEQVWDAVPLTEWNTDWSNSLTTNNS